MPGDGFQTLLTVGSALVALLFVLAAAVFTIRWMGRRMSVQTTGKLIKVLDRTVIGQDKCLLLVQVTNRYLLVGMSGNSVALLCELGDISQAVEQSAAQRPPEFSEMLGEAFKKGAAHLKKKEDDEL
ncbi:MAG: flagellar biosynthetic protein FliO [Angelakisella sp.]